MDSRYAQDPDEVTEYQQVITLVGSAPAAAPGAPIVVDFPLAGSDVDEAIAIATAQWGTAPVRASFYSMTLSGRSGLCQLSLTAGSDRVYALGIAALPGDATPVTRTAPVLPNMPLSTDSMTPADADEVLAGQGVIHASCEPLAHADAGPTSFTLTGGFQAERR